MTWKRDRQRLTEVEAPPPDVPPRIAKPFRRKVERVAEALAHSEPPRSGRRPPDGDRRHHPAAGLGTRRVARHAARQPGARSRAGWGAIGI